MGTETKVKNLGLMTHRTVARLCDLDTETLRKWVANGVWPEPHSIIQQTWFYPSDVILFFVQNGTWPEGTKFRAGVGNGRKEPLR
jgi:hypothetical protein